MTVCSPKATSTKLNTDLEQAKLVSLTNDTRIKLSRSAEEAFSDLMFQRIMKNESIVEEENKYYNWYNGYSYIGRGYFDETYNRGFSLSYMPIATKGSFSTRNFGLQSLNIANETETKFSVSFYFEVPESVENSNITLFWKIEYVSIKDISKGFDRMLMRHSETLDPNTRLHYFNFTPPSLSRDAFFRFERDVEMEELVGMKLTQVPGFNFSWYYSDEVVPERRFTSMSSYPRNEEFRMLANLVHASTRSTEENWRIVQVARFQMLKNPLAQCTHEYSFVSEKIMKENRKELETLLQLQAADDFLEIDPKTLEESAKMFVYLNACPDPSLLGFSSFYQDMFLNNMPDLILLTLHRLQLKLDDNDLADINKSFLNHLLNILDLDENKSDDSNHHTYHPVHIIADDGELSQSAFIPFCEFGGNMSVVGVKIDQFDSPVCDSFRVKTLNDQLCYEVDLNLYEDQVDKTEALKYGLVMLIDNNEDRRGNLEIVKDNFLQEESHLIQHFRKSDILEKFTIHINTLGRKVKELLNIMIFLQSL